MVAWKVFISFLANLFSILMQNLGNILSLLFVGYISIRVAYLVSKSEFIDNQKKLAKTSIWHLRATNGELRGVERLIETRKKKIKGELPQSF